MKNKKRLGVVVTSLALVLSMAFSFAYFTDRAEVEVNVYAGTVGIDETASEVWQNQLEDNAGTNTKNLNPGDSRSLKFTISNTDTKAIDVRHTIKLTVEDAYGNPKALDMRADIAGEQMLQFDIFKASDVVKTSEANGNAGYDIKKDAKPVVSTETMDAATKMGVKRDISKIANGEVIYYFADSVLNGVEKGTLTNPEVGYALNVQGETAKEMNLDATLNADGTAVTYDYVLIFRDNSLNDFQGCHLYVEMAIEAKQHLNTKSSWQNVYTVDYTFDVAGADQANTFDTVPDNQTGTMSEGSSDASTSTMVDGSAKNMNSQDDSGTLPPVKVPQNPTNP